MEEIVAICRHRDQFAIVHDASKSHVTLVAAAEPDFPGQVVEPLPLHELVIGVLRARTQRKVAVLGVEALFNRPVVHTGDRHTLARVLHTAQLACPDLARGVRLNGLRRISGEVRWTCLS